MAQTTVSATSFLTSPFASQTTNGARRLSSHASFSRLPNQLTQTTIATGRFNERNLRIQRISVKSEASPDVSGRSNDQASSKPSLVTSPPESPASSSTSSASPAPSPPRKPSSLRGLVLSAGPPGAWDGSGVGKAVVRRFLSDNEERWFMWYEGWTNSGDTGADGHDDTQAEVAENQGESAIPPVSRARTGVAVSANGLHWRRGDGVAETDAKGRGSPGVVLQPSANWWHFDTRHVSVSDVTMMSSHKVRASGGVLWMFYVGGNAEELPLPAEILPLLPPRLASNSTPPSTPAPSPARDYTEGEIVEGLRTRIGLAMSHDGRNWARIEGEHHSGAVMDVGEAGEWDALFHGAPQIVFHEAGDIRLFYHSLDLSSGKKSSEGGPPRSPGSPGSPRFRVGFARSRDGLKWVKFGPVFSGSNGKYAFDALGVTSRYVMRDPRASAAAVRGGAGKEGGDSRKYVMLYEGVAADGSSSIGLAESEDGMSGWTSLGPVFEPNRGAKGQGEGEGEGDGEVEGEAGAWDSWSVGSPCLVDLGGGHLRLYYVGADGRGFQGIGAAESLDGSFEFQRCANLETLL